MPITVAAHKLRRLLERRQMTQADLARVLDVKRNTVTYWLRGRSPRGLDGITKLVEWSNGYITVEDFTRPYRHNVIYPDPSDDFPQFGAEFNPFAGKEPASDPPQFGGFFVIGDPC